MRRMIVWRPFQRAAPCLQWFAVEPQSALIMDALMMPPRKLLYLHGAEHDHDRLLVEAVLLLEVPELLCQVVLAMALGLTDLFPRARAEPRAES